MVCTVLCERQEVDVLVDKHRDCPSRAQSLSDRPIGPRVTECTACDTREFDRTGHAEADPEYLASDSDDCPSAFRHSASIRGRTAAGPEAKSRSIVRLVSTVPARSVTPTRLPLIPANDENHARLRVEAHPSRWTPTPHDFRVTEDE